MAELPGWDRDRLAVAASPDVTAARWLIFARALESTISHPFEHELEVLTINGENNPKRRERALRALARSSRNDLHRAISRQRAMRILLMLDDPDEPPDEDEP